MKGVVNILHLSDLHFGDESITDAARRKNVLDKLIDTLKGTDNEWKPHLIVISGDIGWMGAREDYELAKEWLNKLLRLLGLNAKELIVCAGNHDIYLNEAEFLAIPSHGEDADNFLKVENLNRFTPPFENYISFCMEMGIQPFFIGKEHSYLVGSREVAGLRFIVFNSAWFCRKDSMDKLWIGLPQLEVMEAAGQLRDKNMITIAVLHHPPECLNEEEINGYGNRLNTYEYLSEHCSMILSGHVHGALKKCDQKYQHAFLFTGGSTYSGDRVRNNFSLFRVNPEKGTVTRNPYDYDPAYGKWGMNEVYQVIIDIKKKTIVKKEVPIKDFHHTLLNGSKKYYQALTGVNGRFKHLKIADIILPRPENEWIETCVVLDAVDDDGDKSLNVLSAMPVLWEKNCKHCVILGEGGMGKTVSMIRLWEEYTKEYKRRKPIPIFIQLNEYNNIPDGANKENFVISMIKENYLGASVTDTDIWEAMITPIKDDDGFVPSILLLLDGFNEITVEKRELLIELRKIIEQARGVQIIISSRYDMRANFNWNEFNLLSLLKLEDTPVDSYLKEQNMPVPDIQADRQNRLRQLIKNPMMLTLYAATCEVVTNHRDDKRCAFKKRVETPGELLWNFLESQVVKFLDRDDMEERNKWFYKFLLKFILPAIGYEMEKAGQFELSRDKLNEVIETYCTRFSQDDFSQTFPGYEKYEDDLNVGKCADNRERRRRRAIIIEILSEELHMMVNELDSFRFLHQNFRDFFAAAHILNEVSIGLRKNEVAEVLKERALSIYLRRYIGEMEGEHYCKPFLVKGKGWKIKENKDSLLYRAIDLCRGCFDKSIGFAVWNIVETWKEVRGELSGANLSNLDLSKILLNGVRCNRFYKDTYLSVTFEHALLHEENLFSQGHADSVENAVYSPDGKKILSASLDETIKEWNIETGECLKTFEGYSYFGWGTVYSPDGEKILFEYSDKTTREWNVKTGKCLKIFRGHSDALHSAVYSPDGKKILSAISGKAIKEWNIKTGKCLKTFRGHSDTVNSAVYSPDGKKILSPSSDKTIKEWNVKTGKCLKTFRGHSDTVNSAIYNPDGKKILSASEDGTIKEWNIETGECLKTLRGHSERIESAVYSPDGKKILSASSDETIKEWDVETGECLRTVKGHLNRVSSAIYSTDGKKILSASEDRAVKEWDVETGECLRSYKGYSDELSSATYSPDLKKILSASWDESIKEWDMETGECLRIFKGHSDIVFYAVYSVDGKNILSTSADQSVKEWDVDTGKCLKTFKGHTGLVRSAVYSNDGKKILSVSTDKSIKEWDVNTGECLKTYRGHNHWANSAVYRSDGKRILSASYDKTIKEWDIETGKCLKTFKGHSDSVWSAVYSPDGKKILSTSYNRTIKEWDVETGKCLKTLRGHSERIEGAVYSPDGKKILSAYMDQIIKEWDVETGKCLKTYKGNLSMLKYADLGKIDKKLLISRDDIISPKNKIMVLDGETDEPLMTLLNIPGLFIQKCSFENLHPDSGLSEESKKLLKQYGAIF